MIALRAVAAMVAVGCLAGPPAEAFMVKLDNPYQTVVRPTSGSIEVSFFGTITYATGDKFLSANFVNPLYLSSLLDSMPVQTFCPGSVCVSEGTNKKLFSYMLSSTDAIGVYDKGSSGIPAAVVWKAFNTSGTFVPEVVTNFSITVEESEVPLPAATWLLLSGLGGISIVGRRRKPA